MKVHEKAGERAQYRQKVWKIGDFRGRKSISWEEKREIGKLFVTENVKEKFREGKKN